MRKLLLLPILVLALAACAPTMSPTAVRSGEDVTITITVSGTYYDVNLTVLRATTEDGRCVPLDGDLSCSVGDVQPGAPAVVVVTGDVGEVACVASGFTDPALAPTTYRAVPCR